MFENKRKVGEIIRFGIVGIAATAIHYAAFYALLTVAERNVAYTAGFIISLLCNFIMSAQYTFRVKPTMARLIRFAGSHAVNYLVQMLLFNFFYWLGVPVKLAPLPVYAFAVPISFLLVRYALKRNSDNIARGVPL